MRVPQLLLALAVGATLVAVAYFDPSALSIILALACVILSGLLFIFGSDSPPDPPSELHQH